MWDARGFSWANMCTHDATWTKVCARHAQCATVPLEPSPLCCLSLLALRQGDDTPALMHAQDALDIASEAQARRYERSNRPPPQIARKSLGTGHVKSIT